MFFVYVDETADEIPFYVGKGNSDRVLNLRRNQKHSRVSKKYGRNRIVLVETEDESEAFEFEKAFIQEFHTFVRDPLAGRLACNFTVGGEGISGHTHSIETRKKLRESHIGKTLSIESRRKVSISLIGNKRGAGHSPSLETRKRLSESQRGNTHCLGHKPSVETRRKMSETRKGKPVSEESRIKRRSLVQSEEAKRKIGLAHKGKVVSAETRKKQSVSQKLRFRKEREGIGEITK